jgi:hypothetical protein
MALGRLALAEAGVGVASRSMIAPAAARWGVTGRVAISEEVAVMARNVRFSPKVRGPLSDSLARWSANGTRAGELAIARNGSISGNGYLVARIAPRSGVVYSPDNLRLGFVGGDGLLYEYSSAGGTRAIGMLRGFTSGRPIMVRATDGTSAIVAHIPANGIVRVTRIGEGGYLVRLENGATGWVAADDLTMLALLGIDQAGQRCGSRAGAIVTKDNRLIRFDRCSRDKDGAHVVAGAQQHHIPDAEIATILHGGTITDPGVHVRRTMLASLDRDGIIFPPASAYTEFPFGYGPNAPGQAPDFGNLPLGYGNGETQPPDLENVPQCLFAEPQPPFSFYWYPRPMSRMPRAGVVSSHPSPTPRS